jgi:spartin
MAGHNDPRMLFSIPGIRAYHIQHGEESSLTPSGAQTLSLLMVSTASPFADLSTANPQSEAAVEDFYLHIHLPPELDLPLPASTQIFHQPPTSYLIPRWDLGPDSGAFTRIEFPGARNGEEKIPREDVDTFETILAQCTAFLERAPPPTKSVYPNEKRANEKGAKGYTAYDPSHYGPGEGYASADTGGHGHIVLVDEENGSVVGELSDQYQIVEDEKIQPGSKSKQRIIISHLIPMYSSVPTDPVEIRLPQDSTNLIGVRPASPEYLKDTMHPAYKDSTIVSHAANASRLIVTTSGYLASALQSGAENFTHKTKPNIKPMTFAPVTHERVRKLHNLSQGAAGLSAKTVGQVSRYAQNVGATMARRGERQPKGLDKNGKAIETYKPGILNKSMMAFSTIADGIDHSARHLLQSGSLAATTVVGHRYGDEAKEVAKSVTGGIQNVGLVYVDTTGVSRKAIIKSVAKGMVIGRVKGGGQVIVGGGDGGIVTSDPYPADEKKAASDQNLPGTGQAGRSTPGMGEVGFGNAAPPAYGSGVGEPLGGTALQGQDSKGFYE